MIPTAEFPTVVVAAVDHSAKATAQPAVEQLRRAVIQTLLDSRQFRVLETVESDSRVRSPRGAMALAEANEIDFLVLVRLHHVRVDTGVHHVRRYHDASAAGQATLLSVRSGQALQLADERVYLSTRARYSAPGYARELALSRLAGRLSRGLLGRRTGRFVDLADPDDGSQRQGRGP